MFTLIVFFFFAVKYCVFWAHELQMLYSPSHSLILNLLNFPVLSLPSSFLPSSFVKVFLFLFSFFTALRYAFLLFYVWMSPII